MDPVTTQSSDKGLNLSELVRLLTPHYWSESEIRLPRWPPDAFAIVASILDRSGAYRQIVCVPRKCASLAKGVLSEEENDLDAWTHRARTLGFSWRDAWANPETPDLPEQIQGWWETLNNHRNERLENIAQNSVLYEALVNLIAVSDEACMMVGSTKLSELSMETPAEENDWLFLSWAQELLYRDQQSGGTTLCENIHKSRLRVLPKARTTQKGLTFRSCSHHLALCVGSEVQPFWWITPRSGPNAGCHFLNILLFPWPFEIAPDDFYPSDHDPVKMADGFGSFKLNVKTDREEDLKLQELLTAVIARAEKQVGKLDGIILPECSLSTSQFNLLKDELTRKEKFLIAGVYDNSQKSFARNLVCSSFPLSNAAQVEEFRQFKHHRWCLDRHQILNYRLSSKLNPKIVWWEAIEINERQIQFYAIEEWLTLCTLVCEDLARQDPVSNLVRGVGPNLVVALLADGPQLKTRWAHQYAAVLADDPGSSVLSFTSLGMATLSRPFHQTSSSRVVALWKDAKTGTVEIDLPPNSKGIVLSLFREELEEFTADGRSDGTLAAAVVLGGIITV